MQRTISIDTDVYAAIWAARVAGEQSENDVLRRLLLGGEIGAVRGASAGPAVGFHDARHDVSFPAGMEIVRDYKGKRYSAVARDGHWVRVDNGVAYRSLNRLNASIVAGAESVWNGKWSYLDADGRPRSIATLRERD